MQYSTPLKVIEVQQKIGKFYLAKMKPSLLQLIANKSLSRYQNVKGIQRDPNPEKINDIQNYISTDPFAAFPNTIIISLRDDLDQENPLYKFDDNDDLLIALDPEVANIIDGQHRLAAFVGSDDSFELPVSIFLDLSLGEQAKLFAIINSTQTKVPLDLVYEDFFQSKIRTEEKASFYIVKKLNEDPDSAWYEKIKTLTERKGRDLAQGSMAKYIHKNLLSDGKILRPLYLAERDNDVYSILNNFFSAIKNTFPEEWENNIDRKSILKKTTGFNAFMKYFIWLLKNMDKKEDELTTEFFSNKLNKAKVNLKSLTNDEYASGAVGQNLLWKHLTTEIPVQSDSGK